MEETLCVRSLPNDRLPLVVFLDGLDHVLDDVQTGRHVLERTAETPGVETLHAVSLSVRRSETSMYYTVVHRIQ